MTPANQVREIILACSKAGARMFRMNVGLAWSGSDVRKNRDGSITIMDPRPFKTGVKGMSDVGGFVPVIVTPEMVGQVVPVYAVIECKTGKGRLTPEQAAFIQMVLSYGGRAGVARSVEDALEILNPSPKPE